MNKIADIAHLFENISPPSSPEDRARFLQECKDFTEATMRYNTSQKGGCNRCLGEFVKAEWNKLIDEYLSDVPDAQFDLSVSPDGKDYFITYHNF